MILLQNIQEFKQQITVKGEVSNVVPEFNESEPDNYEYGDEFSSYYDGGDSDVETWILTRVYINFYKTHIIYFNTMTDLFLYK